MITGPTNRCILRLSVHFNSVILLAAATPIEMVIGNFVLRPAALALLADVGDLEGAPSTLPLPHRQPAPVVLVHSGFAEDIALLPTAAEDLDGFALLLHLTGLGEGGEIHRSDSKFWSAVANSKMDSSFKIVT